MPLGGTKYGLIRSIAFDNGNVNAQANADSAKEKAAEYREAYERHCEEEKGRLLMKGFEEELDGVFP